jgi:hypothetical protein
VDYQLNLLWVVRVEPIQWLTQCDPLTPLSPTQTQLILDGPFHDTPACNERLEEYGGHAGIGRYGNRSPSFSERCPGCNTVLFEICDDHGFPTGYVSAWRVRAQVLTELQRMHRLGWEIRQLSSRVLAAYPDVDWPWLTDQVKLKDAQNRLGFLVALRLFISPLP